MIRILDKISKFASNQNVLISIKLFLLQITFLTLGHAITFSLIEKKSKKNLQTLKNRSSNFFNKKEHIDYKPMFKTFKLILLTNNFFTKKNNFFKKSFVKKKNVKLYFVKPRIMQVEQEKAGISSYQTKILKGVQKLVVVYVGKYGILINVLRKNAIRIRTVTEIPRNVGTELISALNDRVGFWLFIYFSFFIKQLHVRTSLINWDLITGRMRVIHFGSVPFFKVLKISIFMFSNFNTRKKKEFTLLKHSSIELETQSRSLLMSVSKETEEHVELIETLLQSELKIEEAIPLNFSVLFWFVFKDLRHLESINIFTHSSKDELRFIKLN
ncbi:hypothetical protein BpHYR1_006937 [Brachionus plicatilis]|uniref:Uncharacterized protein n=1 Tax=Brachionus plicatilis TaxID=10195 RepID=A0A3M7SG49_BRAPC|nr:hypothetical protein BpHYR1_006937 [Brachionus plicatilis]